MNYGYGIFTILAYVQKIIEDKAGVRIDEDVFLNANLTQVDITNDVFFEKRKLSDYLSTLRELAYKNTNKNLIHSYHNEYGYENSILIRSSCKTVKDSLTVYNKFDELYSKRKQDNGFYNNFSAEFLNKCKQILRFERRIIGKKQLCQALHLPAKSKINLYIILSCRVNLLEEKINMLIG